MEGAAAGFLDREACTGGHHDLNVGEIILNHFLEGPFHLVGQVEERLR